MSDIGVSRENYFGQNLNGNNVKKYLKHVDTIFDKFTASLSSTYPNFPLLPRMTKYRQLFQAFYNAYQAINHSKEVTNEDCNAAERYLSDYMSLVHEFSWPTTTNKVTYKLSSIVKLINQCLSIQYSP